MSSLKVNLQRKKESKKYSLRIERLRRMGGFTFRPTGRSETQYSYFRNDMRLKEVKQKLIVEASVQVFSTKGFHEAKMQDIADAAGVGKGTLYEYFSTKEELFLAVYDSWIDEYENEMTEAATSSSIALSQADAMIDKTVEFYEKHAQHAAILLEFWAHALRSQNPLFLERIRSMKSRLALLGGKVTEKLVKEGAFVEMDVASFTKLELAMSDGVFLQWILDGKSYSLKDAYKFRQSLIGTGLMATPLRKLLSLKTASKLKAGFLGKAANTKRTKSSIKEKAKKFISHSLDKLKS
ncbi:MAG: TetR/AcrR family transcriptional regulator [Chloroherpetonaceae bacterium]|nr:TetR/AcrR family transcriptional regulator [Chloroherpetonaceae bacterium]